VSCGEEIDQHRQAHARKYLVQLAKHWSHRFPDLTWNETRADIPFPAGQCVVTSKENILAIALAVPDEETASRLENVVAEHLKRFAFRESRRLFGNGRNSFALASVYPEQ
jgi:uncharacterized protein